MSASTAPDAAGYAPRDSVRAGVAHVAVREAWFAALPNERKEANLFELEMLLHGIRAFAVARNQPGPTGSITDETRDPAREVVVLRAGMLRVIQLVGVFLGEENAFADPEHTPLSMPPPDGSKERVDVRAVSAEDSPEASLRRLRTSFQDMLVMLDAVSTPPIQLRNVVAFHSTLSRIIEGNVFFHPGLALEFRSEFDRIRHPEVLDALHSITSVAAHQVTAISLLSLFRGLRYVDTIETYASQQGSADTAYLIFAAFRNDVRALTRFLGRKARDLMADGLERELLSMQAVEIVKHHETLAAQAARLVSLRAALDTMATSLRIEVRRAFERELAPLSTKIKEVEFVGQIVIVAAQLRAAFEHAILLICEELRPGAAKPALLHGALARKAASERLRRDVWMFSQVLRAFVAKAAVAEGVSDRWASQASFHFVREFHRHFRAIGYQLVRMTDYQRLRPFVGSLDELRGIEILSASQMQVAVNECKSLQEFLDHLFSQISKRKELTDTPFDKKSAAEALKLYLQAS